MSELKDNPTQDEYDANPEYFMDFERRLRKQWQELVSKAHKTAYGEDDLDSLRNQIVILGGFQASVKYACLTGEYPLWQKIEMFDTAVMYHDVIGEIDQILLIEGEKGA